MNMFRWLTKRSKKVINVIKRNLGPIPNSTCLTNLIFQLHLLKAKFLANYLLKFNRLAIVGNLDGRAFKRCITCQEAMFVFS